MSTQLNTYVMWGVLLPYSADDAVYDQCDPYLDSAFDPAVNAKNGITVLFDGMCGEYIAVGHVVDKTENYRGFERPISIGRPKRAWKDGLRAAIAEIGVVAAPKPAWLVVSHYR